MWRANRFFLWIVSAKVRQVFETTKFLEKFFSPIDFWVPKARIKKAPRSAIQASHHIDSTSVSINYHRHQAPTMYRTLPTTLSLELRMQRYDKFLNPPNFRRSFFWTPRSCVLHLLYYIGSPSDALNIKNLLTTHEAQTLPKPRSFELRVQRYINFSNPPNIKPTFFRAHIPVSSATHLQM